MLEKIPGSFKHTKLLNNIPGLLWKMSIIYVLTIAFNVNVFIYIFIWIHFTFHNYFCKRLYHSRVVENSSYKIPQLEFCKF